jgi:cysteinyl-tRNA synthetase
MTESPLRLYNSLTRRVEPFAPLEPGHVRLYTCGPTVYNYAHIGNFRAYVFEDVLKRHLRHRGYRVTHVMNLTDVDDKTIQGAVAAGLPLRDFTRQFSDAFFADLATLRIAPADVYPAATDHIPEMIALITTLLEKGHAYRTEDGSVYFRIASFPEYGKLAHLDRSALRVSVRVDNDEYGKDNVADFALWKAWSEKDGPVAWDSPWGRGRPGWHIECSAMAMKYLGESFDLHCGGVDNLFPHHEDEIAQSECCTGKTFVRTWLHCEHLIVDGRKMSKSAGNFFTLRDLAERGFSGREVRFELLAARYRQQLNFTLDSLRERRVALARLDDFVDRMQAQAGDAPTGSAPAWASEAFGRFESGMDDDLNTPVALGGLFDFLAEGFRALQENRLAPAEARAALDLLQRMDGVFALLPEGQAVDPALQALLDRRQAFRAARDWAAADRVRDELAALGWSVKDTAQGPRLVRR